MRFLCYNFLYNGVYVNSLKDADRLAPEERGGHVNKPKQLKPFRDNLSHSPRGAFMIL